MRAARSRSFVCIARGQQGSVLLLASAFVFLMTYLALSTVDLAVVEARMAKALRVQIDTRTLLDGAIRLVMLQEQARLQQALANGDGPRCDAPGLCDDARGWVMLHAGDQYQVSYQTRLQGAVADDQQGRLVQSAASSHVHFDAAFFEVDVRVTRHADNATLARAAAGIAVSVARVARG